MRPLTPQPRSFPLALAAAAARAEAVVLGPAALAVALAFALAPASAGAATPEWPRFRGPEASGVSDDAPLPSDLGPKALRWRVSVPMGRSSPIVVGRRVYLTALDGDALATLAYDRDTGALAWRRDLPRSRRHEIYEGNDSATPTPATDGESLYVFFPDFGLAAFDLEGRERWRLELGPFDSFYGLASSPVVHGDTLALVCDQRKGSFAIAVDTKTGRQRWRAERPHADTEAYSTPVVYAPPGGRPQLLVSGGHRVDGYDLGTGENLWWVGKLGIYPAGSPVLLGDLMISVSTGGDEPEYPPFDAMLQKLDANKDGLLTQAELDADPDYKGHFGWVDTDGDGRMVRTEWDVKRNESVAERGVVGIRVDGRGDRTASSLLWRYKKSFSYLITPLVYRDAVYLVKSGGIVTTLDPRTGEVIKTGRSPEAIDGYFASPVAGDGKVYLLSQSGKATVLKAGREWEVLGVSPLGERCEATPAIASGRIYVRTDKALYSFGLPAAQAKTSPEPGAAAPASR